MAQYDRYTTENGKVLNKRTLDMWNEAEHILGVQLPITQGSYNSGKNKVPASAGVHDGGGAVDTPPKVKGATTREIVTALRRVGFAAWHRPYKKGVWPEHIHAVALGDKEASWQAKNQMSAYLDGYNGLGHLGRGGKDKGPRKYVHTWETYKKNHPGRFPVKKK